MGPSPERPNGIPSGKPFLPPPPKEGLLAGSFWAWIEDAEGHEILHNVTIAVDGTANGPDGQADPRWADTGIGAQFPMEMVRRAPHNEPIYWDPGLTVILAVTVIFEDAQLGDKVQCWQDDAAGLPKPDSERTTVYQLPGSRGVISVNCNFIFH
jgi:hypothetical protein